MKSEHLRSGAFAARSLKALGSGCGVLALALAGRGDTGLVDAARSSVARVAGRQPVQGLREKVEVIRDRWGIPHIYARNNEDLFFAQGYVQAQDRLFQMEMWRRQTQGRLAELLGPEWVERDRLTRLVTRFRGDMEAEWRSYDPDARHIVASFVRGVNAQIAQRRARRPFEFERAGLELEEWRPEDLLARAEAFSMSGNAVAEVSRARTIAALGIEAALRLRPLDPPLPPGSVVPAGLDVGGIDDKLATALASIGAPARFAPPRQVSSSGFDDEAAAGSNNWAIAGRRTVSGRPFVANDPHRNLDHPSLRYLVHLDAPDFKVIGAVVPWFPGVAIGHNDRVAWGLTIFAIDAQDLFVEETDPQQPTRYRVDDGWELMRVERELIKVRGAAPVEVELRFTRHGPVVYEDRPRRRAYALQWTGSEPGTAGYLAGLALDRARSALEFRAAARRWRMPGENFVFADVDGNVGYQATGLAPIRKAGSGLVPAPGAAGTHDWQGFHPQEVLPNALNPPGGFIATANHNTQAVNSRIVVGHEWSTRHRIDRIEEVLREPRSFSLADMQALQQDVLALPARAFVPLLEDLVLDDSMCRQARDLLLAWDHRLTRDSAAGAVFVVWQVELAREVAQRIAGNAAIEASLLRAASATVIESHLARPGAERDRLLADTLARAVIAVRGKLGAEPRGWSWGKLHTAAFNHPLAVDEMTHALFNRGPVSRPGYGFTVNATGGGDFEQTSGATFRYITEVGNWDATVATTAPGQSGEPGSSHFDDLVSTWSEGRYVPLVYSRKKVEEVTANRLVLEPLRRAAGGRPSRLATRH